ncbi:hypothetical protein CLV92_11198 [Kineococcus xinjiangensis]|uniref:Very-short-patch-repair endonuclease n=1 Tax=Kineococcus xinjiangensis TaxID=512762 RepID=A0A2S6IG49_9ACTN|nr:hypothetical protein [Kineococcus xinjiangensis]PPK93181.1 hypothetical protein CLV92_11198 [Kineococcus xinjiangensis]
MRTPLPADLPRVFRGADAVAHGALTEEQLRGPAVQRVLRGVYARSGTALTHDVRCEATGLLLPPGALVTGRSAATVRGVPLARRQDPVEVLVPEQPLRRLPSGVLVRRCRSLPAGEPWGSTALAPPLRMAFDLTARHPLPAAVGHLDAVVRAGLVDLDALHAWLVGARGPGVRAARHAAQLCDPRAESPPESAVRVHCVEAGLAVTPQVVVRDRGCFVARVDLAVDGTQVAVQYDGQWHALREQLEADRRQLRELREAGWEVVHVTVALRREPDTLVAAVHAAIARQVRR